MERYIGHPNQVYGVEEMRLCGGRGDGMRMLCVRNATGLFFMISADRAADIVRLSVKGDNYGFISPCGFVSPAYYNKNEFLASFTAGFCTTCGLTAVGAPCVDDGEETFLHGTVSNIPCEHIYHFIENGEIHIRATVRDAALFGRQLLLEREYICPVDKNEIRLIDRIKNIGTADAPLEVLYHCNMGYPLLDEHAKLAIPHNGVRPRTEHSATGLEKAMLIEPPQRGHTEMCFYYEMSGTPTVTLMNEKLGRGVSITYDAGELPFFTEWKMMGEGEYVLGLEPGNCLPDGRAAQREMGRLEILAPGAEKVHHLTFGFPET